MKIYDAAEFDGNVDRALIGVTRKFSENERRLPR
jgi:hypothetical protein